MYIPGHSGPQIYFPCGRINMFATYMVGNPMSLRIGLAIARDILPGLHKISTYCVFGTVIFFLIVS